MLVRSVAVRLGLVGVNTGCLARLAIMFLSLETFNERQTLSERDVCVCCVVHIRCVYGSDTLL